jgi:hypothetical protein
MKDDNNNAIEKLIKSKIENYDQFAIEIERRIVDEIAEDRLKIKNSYDNISSSNKPIQEITE